MHHHLRAAPALRPVSLAAALVLSLGMVAGASTTAGAEETALTSATVTLEGGGLSISAPVEAGNLSTEPTEMGGVTVSGRLGQVQVIDSRGAPAGAGWTATAISTAFTQASGPSVTAAAVGYTVGTITKVGTATYTANDPASLASASAVVTATEITGDNTASWNPTIHVTFPAGKPAGVYLGSITHSVS